MNLAKDIRMALGRVRPFDASKVGELTFGTIDALHDNLLRSCLVITGSIVGLLRSKWNYVIAPRGAGKTAVYKAFENDWFAKELFDRSSCFLVLLNKAFDYDCEYLDHAKFVPNLNYRNYILSWGLFIAMEVVGEIRKRGAELSGHGKFLKEMGRYEGLKDKFRLYGLLDYIDQLNISLSLNLSGQNFNLSPRIKVNTPKLRISLNEIFDQINSLMHENGKQLVILIDRLDDFVGHEEYQVQRNYVQGVFDVIEEICTLDAIRPILFLRNDLFSKLHINVGYDKVQDRVCKLNWDDGEILRFIKNRFLSNRYIRQNYQDYLNYCGLRHVSERLSSSGARRFWMTGLFRLPLLRSALQKSQGERHKHLQQLISEDFVALFFPKKITHVTQAGGSEETTFLDWVKTHLSDQSGYVSPRQLISLFNNIFRRQHDYYAKDATYVIERNIRAVRTDSTLHFPIFSPSIIQEAFVETQKDAVRVVHHLLDPEEQAAFGAIAELAAERGTFRYGDLRPPDFGLTKERYEDLLSYLKTLGHLKEVAPKKYSVPILYRAKYVE